MRRSFVILATLACLAIPGARVGAQASAACGVERWPVKIGADADVARVDTVPERATVTQLASLPRPYAMAARERAGPYEMKTYTVTARVLDLFREEDSDWHIVLADTGEWRATIIAELPAADCAYGSRYQDRFASLAPVMDSLRPGSVVEVTGLGFFDVLHGQRGIAPNAFELHPILGLVVIPSEARNLLVPEQQIPPRSARRNDTGQDTVWVNTRSHVYHCQGSRWYGRTTRGYFTTEHAAIDAGARPAYGRACGARG
jgi:hypothetical protein